MFSCCRLRRLIASFELARYFLAYLALILFFLITLIAKTSPVAF
jgi:hypothetical protein